VAAAGAAAGAATIEVEPRGARTLRSPALRPRLPPYARSARSLARGDMSARRPDASEAQRPGPAAP
jgi:hypothetical protein